MDDSEELGAHTVGNTLLITALAAALIDAKVISRDQLLKSISAFKSMMGNADDAMMLKPLEQCEELLDASAGPFGHTALVEFSALRDLLDGLGKEDPENDEGARP